MLDLKPHWVFLAPSVSALVGTIILGIIVLVWDPKGFVRTLTFGLVGLLVLAALAFFLQRLAIWSTTNFVVTSQRLIAGHGVLSKHRKEIPLDRVNDVSFSQGIFDRLVGAGSLTIESAGERGQETFQNVNHPDTVQQHIYSQMEARMDRRYGGPGYTPPDGMPQTQAAPAAAGPSVAEQIEQLHDLLQRGAISQAEFDAKKAELLGRM